MPLSQSLIDKIQRKELAHAALQHSSLNDLSFNEKMSLFKLKDDLGKLCLEAAEQANTQSEQRLRGLYLRKVVRYHPFLKPNLVDDPRFVYYDNTALGNPIPKTNASNAKDLAMVVPMFIGVTAFAFTTPITMPIFLLSLASNYSYSHLAEPWLQEKYVNDHCLGIINDNSEDCLSIAVAYLDTDDRDANFLAIRYLLEAEIRSTTHKPEIAHYLARCFQNLQASFTRTHDYGHIGKDVLSVPQTILAAGKDDQKSLWPRLYEIKEKVLMNNVKKKPPENATLKFIWNLKKPTSADFTSANLDLLYQNTVALRDAGFHHLIVGKLTTDHPCYQVTLAELSQYLRYKLFQTYPQMRPSEDGIYNDWILPTFSADKTRTLEKISLVQLVAFMSQVYELPQGCIQAGIASHLLLNNATADDELAVAHLLQLLQAPAQSVKETSLSDYNTPRTQIRDDNDLTNNNNTIKFNKIN